MARPAQKGHKMSEGNQVRQFDLANLSLKDELMLRAALDGLTAVMWLGDKESPARDLTAGDWAEIRAVAKGA